MINLYFEKSDASGAKLEILTILRRHLAEADCRVASLKRFRTELAENIARFEQ